MNDFLVISLLLSMLWLGNEGAELSNRTFPDYFRFGTATASYQIEGAWDADGKGENIWDRLTHEFPEKVLDRSSGDIACDSYNNYVRDVEMVAELGADFYRFSVSWGRIMPNGLTNNINQEGLDYYNKLINALLQSGIEPMVTMYHWDLPQKIQDIGGWANPIIVKVFRNYAKVLFDNYGDRVKLWSTFNEPAVICKAGYGGSFAPSLGMSGLADYQCSHNLLKAHAEVYHLYNNEYRASQKGRIGIVLNSGFYYPATNTDLDEEARQRAIQFQLGFYAHPIFHPDGNYPQVMIDRVANRSIGEGFSHSRIPSFTYAEINMIRGTSDYFGINHYTSHYASYVEDAIASEPNFSFDQGASTEYVESTVHGNNGSPYAPEGLQLLLRWIKDEYNNPEIIITENGFADTGGTNDTNRKMYYQYYLNSVLQAIYDDGVNVTGYTAWSLMDNFEWLRGYSDRFGIYYVDFDSNEKTRTIKKSGEFIKKVIESRCLLDEGCDTIRNSFE